MVLQISVLFVVCLCCQLLTLRAALFRVMLLPWRRSGVTSCASPSKWMQLSRITLRLGKQLTVAKHPTVAVQEITLRLDKQLTVAVQDYRN